MVNRGHSSLSVGANDLLSTNVNILSAKLDGGKRSLLFFPDRLLITQGKDVGAVDYSRLHVAWDSSRFIEEPPAPVDAKVLDHTWQYVNKDGGPDKRFKNNRQYPVCSYNQLRLSSSRGLDVRFQASRAGTFDEERRTPHAQPPVEGVLGGQPVGNGPLLASLAQHPEHPPPRVEVVDVETAQLAHPDAGRVERLQDRHIARRDRVVPGHLRRRLEQRTRLCLVEHRGQ